MKFGSYGFITFRSYFNTALSPSFDTADGVFPKNYIFKIK